MSAGYLPILIEQGDLFELMITIKNPDRTPMDLTGTTFEGMVRKATSDVAPLLTFSFTIQNQTTSKGKVRVYLPTSVTDPVFILGLVVGVRPVPTYIYDIHQVIGSEKYRILQGPAMLSAEATKP